MVKIRLMGKKEDMHAMIKRIYQIEDVQVIEPIPVHSLYF